MFDKVCGTDKIRKQFQQNFRVKDIETLWNSDAEEFRKSAQKYFLY
jgi:uncharacterized protein YbbC (DUF1343 family)